MERIINFSKQKVVCKNLRKFNVRLNKYLRSIDIFINNEVIKIL